MVRRPSSEGAGCRTAENISACTLLLCGLAVTKAKTQQESRGRNTKQSNTMRLLLPVAAVSSSLLLLLLHAPAAVAAPLVDHFSQADGEAYVEAAVRALGDSESSLADKDYAVRLLGALDNPSVASGYKSSACSAAAAGLGSGDLGQIHHGISLGNGVGGCANAKTWRASEEVAEAMKVRAC